MSCNCNTTSESCEPCAFCTPPGVTCLPDCNPVDPCEEKIDLCCVEFSGESQPCNNIQNAQSLCDLIETFFDEGIPPPAFCELTISVDILPAPIVTTSTTSTTTSTTSTSTSTTTTTASPVYEHLLCYSTDLNNGTMCPYICAHCIETNTYYSTCPDIIQNCILYANSQLTTLAFPGYYSNGYSCIVVGNSGVVSSVTNCPTVVPVRFSVGLVISSNYQYPSGAGGIYTYSQISGTPGDTVYLRSTFLAPSGIAGTTSVNGLNLVETTGATVTYSILIGATGYCTVPCIFTVSGNTLNKTGAKFVKNEILSTALGSAITLGTSYTSVTLSTTNSTVVIGRATANGTNASNACSNFADTNIYTIVGPNQMTGTQTGDIVYVDYQNNVKFNGGNNWISFVPSDVSYPVNLNTKYAFQISSIGVINDIAICP